MSTKYSKGDRVRWNGAMPSDHRSEADRVCVVTYTYESGTFHAYVVQHSWGWSHDANNRHLTLVAQPVNFKFAVGDGVFYKDIAATVVATKIIDGDAAYNVFYGDKTVMGVFEHELKASAIPAPLPTPLPLPSPVVVPAPITPIDEQPIPGEHTTAEEGKKRAQSKTIMIAAAAVAAFMLMR